MRCLRKFEWVKLFRDNLPAGKGLMAYWAKLASCTAYKKGTAFYCGYKNDVEAGSWTGGIVGLKSNLGVKERKQAIAIMDKLTELGYIKYEIEPRTKKLTYKVLDLVLLCNGQACGTNSIYAVDKYGFLCVPRTITQRLVESHYKFEESDAWLDLWCHTVSEDPDNAFSFQAASVQYKQGDAALTLETLGERWGWEKTKVWRFFKKWRDVFYLHRLHGAHGCLIFNILYPCDTESEKPTSESVERVYKDVLEEEYIDAIEKNRVAFSTPIIRAYLSLCWCCKSCRYCNLYASSKYFKDCKSNGTSIVGKITNIRGPCECGQIKIRRIIMAKKNKIDIIVDASTDYYLRILKEKNLVQNDETNRGEIDKTREEFAEKVYHNTELLLKQYRNIKWIIDCFPSVLEEELSASMDNLDDLMSKLGIEEKAYGNYYLHNRMKSLSRTKMLLGYLEKSVEVLKKKPKNGSILYRIIYATYMDPEETDYRDIAFRLDLSERHYFRLKSEAIRIISINLWAAPTKEFEEWLNVLTKLSEQISCG